MMETCPLMRPWAAARCDGRTLAKTMIDALIHFDTSAPMRYDGMYGYGTARGSRASSSKIIGRVKDGLWLAAFALVAVLAAGASAGAQVVAGASADTTAATSPDSLEARLERAEAAIQLLQQ